MARPGSTSPIERSDPRALRPVRQNGGPLRLTLAALAASSGLLAHGPDALGHGASRGLHIHLDPDPAERGARVEAIVDASEPLVSLRIAIAGGAPVPVDPKRPARRISVRLVVPLDPPGETVGIVAEGKTEDGKEVRASAVLRLLPPAPGKGVR